MAFDDCIRALNKKMKDSPLTELEQEQITNDLTDIISQRSGDTSQSLKDAVNKAITEKVDQLRIANAVQRRNAYFNKTQEIEMFNYLKDNWIDGQEVGLEAILVGVNSTRAGSRRSVAANQVARAEAYLGGMYSDLARENLFKVFRSGELDADIYKAADALARNQPTDGIRVEAVKIAKILDKHNEYFRLEANRVGATIGKLPGYVTSRSHNRQKIRGDKEGWLDFMRQNIDLGKTFSDVPPEKLNQKLSEMWGDLSTGVHTRLKKSTGPETTMNGLTGFSNVAKGMSHDRVLHFKTPEAEFEYARQFGEGNLAKATFFNAERMAADTVLMERMGPNAKQNLDNAVKSLMEMNKIALNEEQNTRLKNKMDDVNESLWPHISGSARSVATGREMIAKMDSNLRAINQMSLLGGALLSMVSDPAFYAGELHFQGRGFLSGLGESMSAIAKLKTTPEERQILSSLSVFADSLKGSLVSRFDANDIEGGRMAAATQTFFKWSGIQWWPDRLRDAFALSLSHHLANLSVKPFAELPTEMTRLMKIYDIGENEWGAISKGLHEASDGKKFMTPEALDGLGDEVFAEVLTARGQKVTPTRLKGVRSELANKVQTLFQDRASYAVVKSDVREQALLVGGQEQGKWMRAMRNQFATFKSFPIAVLLKPVARDLFGRSDKLGWAAAVKEGKGLAPLAMTMITATMLGYVSMSLKDIFKGREPRDPTDSKTILAAMLQGGALGIYGDFLFGEAKNRFGNNFLTTLLGPAAGDFNSMADIYGRMKAGDPVAAQAFRFVLNNTPGANLFYARTGLDYLFLNGISEYLSPGYLRRTESRMKKEMDQEFFYPPSQYSNKF